MKKNQMSGRVYLKIVFLCGIVGLLLMPMKSWSGSVKLHVDAERAGLWPNQYQFWKEDETLKYDTSILEWQGQGTDPKVWRTGGTGEYRQGSYGIKFLTRPTSEDRSRSEYWFVGSRSGTLPGTTTQIGTNLGATQSDSIPFGVTRFAGFSIKLYPTTPVSGGFIATQFWQSSPEPPPVSISYGAKNFGSNGTQFRYTLFIDNDAGNENLYNSSIIPRGEWVDFIIESKVNPTGYAYIKLWDHFEGNSGYTFRKNWGGGPGSKIGFDKSPYSYQHKFGIYRPGINSQGVNHQIYIDEVRSGTSVTHVNSTKVNPEDYYALRNRNYSRCLSNPSGGWGKAAAVWGCVQQGNGHEWRFVRVAGNDDVPQYQLRSNRGGDDQCLISETNNAVTIQKCGTGYGNRDRWVLDDRGSGYYMVKNVGRGYQCLFAASASTVDVRSCGSNPWQAKHWEFY